MSEPISVAGATALVLSSGVALFALFQPSLTPEVQAAIILFGNSVIVLGSVLFARARVTPLAAPAVPAGTSVTAITAEGEDNYQVTV